MKKYISDFRVLQNVNLSGGYSLIKLTSNDKLPEILPAQFVQVRVDNSPQTFLRRPISVNMVDYEANELWLLIQKVGAGTHKLCALQAGETVNLIFPLGKTFTTLENKNAGLLLVGGGVGTAPLLYFGKYLTINGFTDVNFLLGGRSAENLLQLNEFAKYGKVYTTTEDGSHGEKGFVTNHSILNSQFSILNYIYCCGPTPMMRAVAKIALAHDIPCEVSLENMMACGIGACLCCVTETTEGNKCVCTEGAVFNAKELKNFI